MLDNQNSDLSLSDLQNFTCNPPNFFAKSQMQEGPAQPKPKISDMTEKGANLIQIGSKMHENFCEFLSLNSERSQGGMNLCRVCWEFLNQPQKNKHSLTHKSFSEKNDLIKGKTLKNFEDFKLIAMKENKFADLLVYECPIINSHFVRLLLFKWKYFKYQNKLIDEDIKIIETKKMEVTKKMEPKQDKLIRKNVDKEKKMAQILKKIELEKQIKLDEEKKNKDLESFKKQINKRVNMNEQQQVKEKATLNLKKSENGHSTDDDEITHILHGLVLQQKQVEKKVQDFEEHNLLFAEILNNLLTKFDEQGEKIDDLKTTLKKLVEE